MATRLYPTNRVMDVQFFTPIRGSFGESTIGTRLHGLVDYTFLLTTDKTLGGGVGLANSVLASGAGPWTDRDVLLLRAVTKPLDPVSLVGMTLDLALGAKPHFQPGAVPPNRIQWVICVWAALYNPATNIWDKAADLLTTTVDPTAFTDDGVPRFFGLTAPLALAGSVGFGQRIVVEIGQRLNSPHTPLAYGSETTQLRVYHGTLSGGVAADGVVGSTLVTSRAGWIEFSGTLTEQADPAAPSHDACADAAVIAALPFTSGVVHAGTSADTNNAIWYTWVADEFGPTYVSSYGSYGYGGSIAVFTGGCAGLTEVASASEQLWIQQSHTLCRWTAEFGVQYWIRIVPGSSTLRAGATRVQVWKRPALADGDLFVDCQHIVGLREGQLIVGTPTFFNLTPTGNAIDYSLRAMTDFNDFGGPGHIALRLAVLPFGFEAVEMLDLATLNYGESEVNFYDYAPPLSSAEHAASIAYDRAGNFHVGFFGDNYDVIGRTPIVAASGHPIKMIGAILDPSSDSAVSAVYPVQFEVQASDYNELSSDNRTLFYTSAGQTIFRYNTATHVQLAPFATVPVAPGPRPGLRSGRLLPPGDGTGGMVICNGSQVVRLDGSGAVVQTYAPADSARAQDLDKIEFAPLVDGAVETFWVSDQLSTTLFKFNLESGAELSAYPLYLAAGQLCGFCVYNGYRAGGAPEPPTPQPLPSACPVPQPEPGGGPTCVTPILGGGS